jgi:Ran GTPase-activating protein (RanGAP) involved in mRNA processing and transport
MQPIPTSCPVFKNDFPNNELHDLEPLLEVLRRVQLPVEDTRFPQGTLYADGRLDLCKQNLGITGCERVVESLRTQPFIHSLLLGTNAIGDDGAAQVAALIRHGYLESVYLGCNGIGAAGVEHIGAALEGNERVKALWLKRNPIGAAGVQRIAQMLCRNSSLRTLDVVNTNPDHDSMLELLGVIASHPSLEYVYLSGNGLDPEEAGALATCLKNPNLKGLYLSANYLGDEGAVILADALKNNSKLNFLGLASNDIGDEGIIALCQVLHDQPSLESLDLGYSPSTKVLGARANRFSDLSLTFILEMLAGNSRLRDLNVYPNPNGFSSASRLKLVAAAHASNLQRFVLENQPVLQSDAQIHLDARRIRSRYR